jgi:hypothetical protein
MKLVPFAFTILVASSGAVAQEIRIGHLETADDIGISWLYLNCSQAGSKLKCATFQTLIFADPKTASCKVFNDLFEMAFTWNHSTQSWSSSDGPTGPCGMVNTAVLEPDPGAKQFWRYTEKKVSTKPGGVLPDGTSCKKVPDRTMTYSWKAATNPLACTSIQHLMN